MTETWERLPDESSLAYRAFIVYRDQGMSRSIEKIQDLIVDISGKPRYKTTRNFYAWSSKYEWVKRARAWDDHLDELRIKEAEKSITQERTKAREIHRSLAKAMQKVLLEKLIPDKNDPSKTMDPKLLNVRDIPQFVKVATELDRMSLDMPTAMVSVTGSKSDHNYSEPGWIDDFARLAKEFGLLPDGEATSADSRYNKAKDDPIHSDNANP